MKLGVLGVSEIALRAVIEPAKQIDGIEVYGIASRELSKAKGYAEKYNIPNYYDSYNALLKDKNIDAVYIPLITALHAEWTIKAIEYGKHVLVEKPICLNLEELDNLKKVILKNPNVVVVEGLMSQHHPWNDEIRKIVNKNKYGNLISIKTNACYKLEDKQDFRLYPDKGGSVFFEEGLLWCHLTQYCLGLNPIEIDAKCDFSGPYGGDHIFHAKLFYDGGAVSECYCSYNAPYEANHYLEFEEALLTVKNFWRPTFGFVKLKIEIFLKKSNSKQIITFLPENYFYNQLKSFLYNVENLISDGVDKSFERIEMMNRIYNTLFNF